MRLFFRALYAALLLQTSAFTWIRRRYWQARDAKAETFGPKFSITAHLTHREHELRDRIVALIVHPNTLTGSRLVTSLALAPPLGLPHAAATVALGWGVVSDLLNGALARQLGKTTRIGKWLDVAADWSLGGFALWYLSSHGLLTPWLVLALLASRIPFACYAVWRWLDARMPDPLPNFWGRSAAVLYALGFVSAMLRITPASESLILSGFAFQVVSYIMYFNWLWYERCGTRFITDATLWAKSHAQFENG